MRKHPQKPLSKVFLDSTGKQALRLTWFTVRSQGVCHANLCRAAGLLLPGNHWSLTYFVPTKYLL